MTAELGILNYELGIPLRPTGAFDSTGGRAAFLIPNSYFLIGWLGGNR